MADATALQHKVAIAHAKKKVESKANVAARRKSSAAIEAGMGASLTQTPAAKSLGNYESEKQISQTCPSGSF